MINMPLPQFNLISINEIKSQLEALLKENLQQLNSHLQDLGEVTWHNLLPFLENLENRLALFWSPVQHLHAVKNTPELRKAYQACLPLLTEYHTTLDQHEQLYQAFHALKHNQHFSKLDPAQQRVIDLRLRDFHLSGVDLPSAQKERYAQIEQQLSELTTKFGEHVLDATQEWHTLVTEQSELQGLPQDIVTDAKRLAEKNQQSGWQFSLNFPTYIAVQQYADHRPLREKFYQAYVTRASALGEKKFDNTTLMQQILALRYELAQLLGFSHFAELSLATKMARSTDEVLHFLYELIAYAKPVASNEFNELSKFAGHDLHPWDIQYYSQKLRQQRYQFDEETLRQYFPVDHVVQTLFKVVEKIFGLKIQELDGVDVWHPDVRCFSITDQQQNLRGTFYMDLYVREQKREGAWMDDYCSRWKKPNGELQHPVVYLTCNFARPQPGEQALLRHDDVITLFHEFGHGCQHLLTIVNYLDVAGIHNVPWDAVEFPSQFMENWCWQNDILKNLAKHYQTGETLPENLLNALLASQHFNAGLQLLRQLEFALFDFTLHLDKPSHDNYIQDILNSVREKTKVYAIPDYNRFQNTFSHIFDGGYAAGYYSYLWAEVLSSDAFSLFEEQGIFNVEIGQRFLNTILAQGGAKPPEKLFIEFRGREPDPKALLKAWGLLDTTGIQIN